VFQDFWLYFPSRSSVNTVGEVEYESKNLLLNCPFARYFSAELDAPSYNGMCDCYPHNFLLTFVIRAGIWTEMAEHVIHMGD
jgi:hypothetical protein